MSQYENSATVFPKHFEKQIMVPQGDMDFNPCIASPFAANKRKVSRESISSKKNVQQWLKLQAIYNRIKDCAEDEDEDRMELCIRKFYGFLHISKRGPFM